MILLSGGYHIDFEDDPPLNSFANYGIEFDMPQV